MTPTSLDLIIPGLYGSRDPLTFWLAPVERARACGLDESAESLARMIRLQREQLAKEFPGVPVEILEQ